MNGRERVLACLERSGPDRPPVRYWGTPPVDEMLREHFRVGSAAEVPDRLGMDFKQVGPRYCGPELRVFPDGSREGLWGERHGESHREAGVFQEITYLPYADVTSVDQLKSMRQPSADWYDCGTVREQCERASEYARVVNGAGTLDFLNGIGRCRGQEQVLLDVAAEDPVFLELVEQRFRFHYELTERTLQAAGGLVEVVWCGEDLGSQDKLLIGPRSFDRLFAEKYRAYFQLAHRHGARVAMHSCGAIRPMIPRLIELGLDVLDVVQVSAAGMDLAGLKADFGERLSFCGTMCVQTTLLNGTPEDVRREVLWRRELFADGGLVLSGTNSIVAGTPLENILELYRSAGSLKE